MGEEKVLTGMVLFTIVFLIVVWVFTIFVDGHALNLRIM